MDVFEGDISPAVGSRTSEKLFDNLAKALLSKLHGDKTWRMGVQGTSVIAGEDNCYPYSYVPTLQRSLGKLLGKMGKRSCWVELGCFRGVFVFLLCLCVYVMCLGGV